MCEVASRIEVNHTRVSRGDETEKLNKKSIAIRTEVAPAFGATEMLGSMLRFLPQSDNYPQEPGREERPRN